MNFDTEAAIDAQRQGDLDRREEQSPKLVVTPPWELRSISKPPEPFPYTGRWAVCPRCGANMPSTVLLAFFPKWIEERAGEECDLYVHECEEDHYEYD